MSRETRRKAYGRGQRAEALAAWWLRLKGYRILVRGFRVAAGAIVLVARRARLIALVDAKAPPSLEQARAAILPRQRERIARAAEVFLHRYPELAGRDLRFDVVLLAPGRLPRHLVNAWHTEEALPRPRAVPRV